MASLYLFNPENDLALAAGTANYTPPATARKIKDGGALLPMWLAQPGDFILAPAEKEKSAAALREKYNLQAKIFTPADITMIDRCVPWGWSAHAVRIFTKAGIDSSFLPDESTIETYRNLSHRRTSIAILESLGFTLLPVEAHTTEQALAAFEAFRENVFIKFPWSCSGRGVFECRNDRNRIEKVATDSIAKQGSVIIEYAYKKIKDFAMLFYCAEGVTQFHALSYFGTYGRGDYSGNMVAPQYE
ncbi:MAG: hypothetical protein K2H84_04930, partial [Paramuribaculum sp.]|nr:hypothetical protein [Paramuribaculum sp.]